MTCRVPTGVPQRLTTDGPRLRLVYQLLINYQGAATHMGSPRVVIIGAGMVEALGLIGFVLPLIVK